MWLENMDYKLLLHDIMSGNSFFRIAWIYYVILDTFCQFKYSLFSL